MQLTIHVHVRIVNFYHDMTKGNSVKVTFMYVHVIMY